LVNSLKSEKSVNRLEYLKWPVLSLFSGAGGFDLGFRYAGFRPGLAIDNDPAAAATYRRNHQGTDVVQLDLANTDPVDLVNLWTNHVGQVKPLGIIGGPPCQAFSVSNVHQRRDDPRRKLLDSYVGIIQAFTSCFGLDFFVFENVPGLIRNRHRHCFQQFKRGCEAAGFEVWYKVIDAGKFGIPQHRERLIVVGVNRQRYPDTALDLPDGDKQPLTIRDVLEGMPEPTFCRKGLNLDDVPFHPNHIAMVPRSPKFTNGQLEPGDRRGRSFRVLKWDSPSYTVAYGHREVHIHPDLHRRISVYEAMLIQGFPSWYKLDGTFSQQIQLVSDALPPPLGEGIANSLVKALGYKKEKVTEQIAELVALP